MNNGEKSYQNIINKRAVALGYNRSEDEAPVVKAKGKGYVADEIIKRARENNIPIQEDSSLVEILSQLEMNERIPTALYGVVAEVFSFVYRVDQSYRGKSS
ncbi:EscU/YscU/HrcU family type III secretion system export apparatus switch protein [Evansella cellulosilytica]|uniref:Type III secretion exporter n=1 Tax=Evansella cellulosilytica (strain ATCC 21833 / DSM 2522 / FERM P-1141 / JCM 9156 / N-4) TaxID=649639 RepID=E6TSY2_EVAC2|nr:EscU/YscU/HrcU family type III secretion system export apparatus switch protein [Evansella cellulosilytica]ADU30774.1 type III secretion exporter [Evansella cellulosilytica DSM 2522]